MNINNSYYVTSLEMNHLKRGKEIKHLKAETVLDREKIRELVLEVDELKSGLIASLQYDLAHAENDLAAEVLAHEETRKQIHLILEFKTEIERLNSGWQKANRRTLELGLELDRVRELIK